MAICKEAKNQNRSRSSYKALSFFHGSNFTLTPVTLEIKIKEVLKPFFRCFLRYEGDEVSGARLINLGCQKSRGNISFHQNF